MKKKATPLNWLFIKKDRNSIFTTAYTYGLDSLRHIDGGSFSTHQINTKGKRDKEKHPGIPRVFSLLSQVRIFFSRPARLSAARSAVYRMGAATMAASALMREAGSLLSMVAQTVSPGKP